MSHTINVAELTDHDAVLRLLGKMQSHGVAYSLVQDGVEVAKVVPVDDQNDFVNDKVSDEVTVKRLRILDEMDEFSKEVARLWNTHETAVEAVANDRR